jgi:hypothetical protein
MMFFALVEGHLESVLSMASVDADERMSRLEEYVNVIKPLLVSSLLNVHRTRVRATPPVNRGK